MISQQTYLIPDSVSAAISLATEQKTKFKFIAGGTDVMVNKYQGNETADCLIDLSKISSLKGVTVEDGFLRIGSMEILASLAKNELVLKYCPVLAEAIITVGSPLIRQAATIGGNVLCENRCLYYNQSEWWRESVGYCLKCDGDICIATQGKNACFSELVSDTAPAFIALNAQIEFTDNTGEHKQPLESIYTGDGVHPKNLDKNAIVTALLVPIDAVQKTFFAKLRERESLEFTSLTCCICSDSKGNIKIALSGVDPKPVVVMGSLSDNADDLIKRAIKGARTVDNDMYSRKYRRDMIAVYIHKGLQTLK